MNSFNCIGNGINGIKTKDTLNKTNYTNGSGFWIATITCDVSAVIAGGGGSGGGGGAGYLKMGHG